jgi:ribosomal protein L11 methyltransferase
LDGFYCRVLVRNLARESEDYFTSFCFEQGAQGVFEELAFTQPDLVYTAQIQEQPYIQVNVIFSEQPPENFFLKVEAEFANTKVERFIEANRDWLEEWKKAFEPFLFVEPFWIIPSWREAPANVKQVINMDPGMAFGTGTHETTRLAAQMIVKNWSRFNTPTRVLDVGTGTGVLGIIAEKLGAIKIEGIDNDPEALRVARENLAKNDSKNFSITESDLSQVTEKFDLVIANIIDGVLLNLKPDLLRVCAEGGKIILSGILKEREEKFIKQFLNETNLKVQERTEDGEWLAFLLESRVE